MKRIVIICLLCIELFAYNRASTYEEVFEYLEKQGIIVGRDIDHDALFSMLQKKEIYLENGQIDLDKLSPYLKPFLHGADIAALKAQSEEEIKNEYNLNEKKAADKEILHYIKNHESQVQREMLDKYINKNSDEEEPLDESMVEEKEEKGWLQSTIDKFLDKIKF